MQQPEQNSALLVPPLALCLALNEISLSMIREVAQDLYLLLYWRLPSHHMPGTVLILNTGSQAVIIALQWGSCLLPASSAISPRRAGVPQHLAQSLADGYTHTNLFGTIKWMNEKLPWCPKGVCDPERLRTPRQYQSTQASVFQEGSGVPPPGPLAVTLERECGWKPWTKRLERWL